MRAGIQARQGESHPWETLLTCPFVLVCELPAFEAALCGEICNGWVCVTELMCPWLSRGLDLMLQVFD